MIIDQKYQTFPGAPLEKTGTPAGTDPDPKFPHSLLT
jgi:hypothetical protein